MDTVVVIGAKYLIYIVAFLAVTVTLLSERSVRFNLIKLTLFSFPIAFLLSLIAAALFYDTRPFVVEQITPLIPHSADNGFPSDHTLFAMTAALTVLVYKRKMGMLLGVLAVIVGVFRVVAKIHYPIDIVGGIAIAIVAVSLAWIILKTLTKHRVPSF